MNFTVYPVDGVAGEITLPGEPSICHRAAYWIALAAPRPWSRMILRNVCLTHQRLGFVDALLRMGVGVREEVLGRENLEWYGNMDIRGGRLRPLDLGSDEAASLSDGIPLLAVLAAKAVGVSTIRRASGSVNRDPDRLAAIASNLRSMGVCVAEEPEGIKIFGTGCFWGAEVESFGDHQIAMAFCIAGLLAEAQATVIRDAECVNGAYPNFRTDLCRLIGPASG